MDQSSFDGNSGQMDGMTPISRLIPHDSSSSGSGRGRIYTERPPRSTAGIGAGSVPPMNPPAQTRDPMAGGYPGGSGYRDGDGDIVGEILRDVEHGSGESIYRDEEPRRQQSHQSHQTQQRSIPPAVHFEETPQIDYNQDAEESPLMMHRPTKMRTRHIEDVDDDEEMMDKQGDFLGDGFLGNVIRETRLPLIVAVLVFLSGLSNADDMLMKLVPVLFTNGNLDYSGLIVKAVVGGLLFYAICRIIL